MPLASGGPGKRSPLLRGPLSRNRPFLQPAVATYEAIGPLSDAATLVDALSNLTAQLALSDTGAVADTLATLQANLALSDTASTVDALATIQAALALTDTGAAVDALQTLMAALSLSDAGSAADAVSTLQAALALTDTGAGTDAISTIQAALALTDTVTGADAISTIQAALALTDTATGANAISTIQAALALTDTALGADALSTLQAALTLTDTVAGADAVNALQAALNLLEYRNAVLSDNPIAYWPLDDAAGPMADVTAGPLSMTVDGSLTLQAPPLVGQGVSVDTNGGTGYLNSPWVGKLQLPPTNWSVECWVKGDPSNTGASPYIFNAYGGGSTGWLFYTESSHLTFWMQNVSLQEAGTHVADGLRHHLVGTYDGTNARFYLDGVLEKTLAAGNLSGGGFPPTDVLIGVNKSLTSPWKGSIDEAAMYTTVLSQAQVTAHYNAGVSTANLARVSEAVAIVALEIKSFTESAAVTEQLDKVIKDVEYKVWHGVTPVTGMGPAMSFERWLDELQAKRKKEEEERRAAEREMAQRAALTKYAEEERVAAYARNVGSLLYYVKTGRLTKAQFLATVAKEQHRWARVA